MNINLLRTFTLSLLVSSTQSFCNSNAEFVNRLIEQQNINGFTNELSEKMNEACSSIKTSESRLLCYEQQATQLIHDGCSYRGPMSLGIKVENPQEKLECYDNTISNYLNWKYRIEKYGFWSVETKKDPFTDNTTLSFYSNGISILCNQGESRVTINNLTKNETFINNVSLIDIMIRFDDNYAKTESWTALVQFENGFPSEKSIVASNNPDTFIKSMMLSNQVIMKIMGGAPETYITYGLREIIKPYMETCGLLPKPHECFLSPSCQ